jgi:hypothetical protein
MEYRKPAITVFARAVGAIQSGEGNKGDTIHPDASDNPRGPGFNTLAAYEADE